MSQNFSLSLSLSLATLLPADICFRGEFLSSNTNVGGGKWTSSITNRNRLHFEFTQNYTVWYRSLKQSDKNIKKRVINKERKKWEDTSTGSGMSH